jgi:hypothetical protein|tara:strand:+ start:790 stop:1023 length:234 start_codon:yes stop_codon:yes gene_type:complete
LIAAPVAEPEQFKIKPKIAKKKMTAPKLAAPKLTAPKLTAPKMTTPKIEKPKVVAPVPKKVEYPVGYKPLAEIEAQT